MVFDSRRVMGGAQGAVGIVAELLGGGDFTVEPADEINEPGVVVEVGFRIVALRKFLEENLRQAGGGGLHADFGQLGSVVPAKEVEQVVLIETILEDGFLFETP